LTSTKTALAPDERRTYRRIDVHYRAIVRLADGTTRPCRVKNISPMGALIEFEDTDPLPPAFRMTIPDELFAADCEFHHQTDNTVGVLFTSGRMEALARFG
jgi:hypothetical protein